jgi:hypothetical protein
VTNAIHLLEYVNLKKFTCHSRGNGNQFIFFKNGFGLRKEEEEEKRAADARGWTQMGKESLKRREE